MEDKMFKELVESLEEMKILLNERKNKIPNEETISAIEDARAKKNMMKIEDISILENLSKQDLELDLLVEDKYKK